MNVVNAGYYSFTDPVNVIGLYPNLLPSDLRNQLSQLHPTKPPILSGDDLEEGMKYLTAYLTQVATYTCTCTYIEDFAYYSCV